MIWRILGLLAYGGVAWLIVGIGYWAVQRLTDTGRVVQALKQLPTEPFEYDEFDQTTAVLRKLFPVGDNTDSFWELMRESRFDCIRSVRQTTDHTFLCERRGSYYSLTCRRSWTVEVSYDWEVGRRSSIRDIIGKTSKDCG